MTPRIIRFRQIKRTTYKVIAISTAIGFVFGLIASVLANAPSMLVVGFLLGPLYGCILGFFLTPIQAICFRLLKVTHLEEPFGIHQVDVLTLNLDFAETFELCHEIAMRISLSNEIQHDESSGTIRITTPWTIKSHGEKILFSISAVDEKITKVAFSSKPVIPTTVFDYGKNVQNARLIRTFLLEKEQIKRVAANDLKIPNLPPTEQSDL